MQNKGLNRNIIDKYYTKKEIVELCINKIKENIKINKKDLIIEPSVGNGAFINNIKELCNNYIFIDIEPELENINILKQDYLDFDYKNINNKKIHIIGNPPFGRQASMAIKFIKKSCEFANTISFILPKSFKKDSMKKYFNNYFHLILEEDLPENSFLVNNKEYNVPCVFQIWKKSNKERVIQEKLKPNKFTFVKKSDNPDISFRRVGVNAGCISSDIENKSEQSHYFIKINNLSEEILNKLKEIKFEFNNTVGPKSISKQELIKEFNKIL